MSFLVKLKSKIELLFLLLMLAPILAIAQVDFNKKPDDDLGNVEDEYQEYFFEALKQKGIENYKRAVDALNKCLSIDDSKPVIYFELGKNYNQLKNFGAAETALKKAIAMQPDNEWFLDELYDVYYKQDDIDNAISVLNQLVKYHPDYKQDLATLYIKQEKFEEALRLLDELDNELGVDEVREEMRNNIYGLNQNVTGEIKKLKAEIFSNPQNENAHLKLIYLYGKSGQAKQAFEAAKTLYKLKPDSKFVHLALYKFYLQENNTENAISSMKLVLNSEEIDEREKTKVLNDFVAFVEKNPKYQKDLIEATNNVNTQKDVKSLSNLGTFYLKVGDKEKALQNYKEALNQSPNDFKLLRDVILLHLELKQHNEALQRSENALELYPAQPILYLLSGVACLNLDMAEQAIENLEMGLDFLIENPKMERDFYLQLSEAYKRTNNNTRSAAFAKKAQAIKAQ